MCLYLGKDTFAPGALNMAKKGSKIAAVTVDGWNKMDVYRKDLFENADLAPPTSYANIVAAVEKLSKQNGIFGQKYRFVLIVFQQQQLCLHS